MQIDRWVLFDDAHADALLPLTFTRPVGMLRIGILTIAEKWQSYFQSPPSWQTRDYLKKKYPPPSDPVALYINGALIPDDNVISAITGLKSGELLLKDDIVLAVNHPSEQPFNCTDPSLPERYKVHRYNAPVTLIKNVWDIFLKNGSALEEDFKRLTTGRYSASISSTNKIIGNGQIFVEEGAKAECAIFNISTGPVYIGRNAEVMEGSVIRGPFALCEGGVVKMSAKIYGPTTIGPFSKVGGEINNSVIQGYSNKAHDGFLGNSVIGEWCNLGADTNNSNLKNNYANVKLWSYKTGRFEDTGLQFCGLIMGDHSKSGINTMFNTGTVVGVSSNIYGSGFPRNFIPSFAWGGAGGLSTYKPEKAFEVCERMMQRRNVAFTETDREILTEIFRITAKYRSWEDKR